LNVGRKDALGARGRSVGDGCDIDWLQDQRRQNFTCGDQTGRCHRTSKNSRWSENRDRNGRRRIRSAAIRARRSVRFGLRMVHRAAHGIAVRARTFRSCLEVGRQRQTECCRDGNQDGQLEHDPSASKAPKPATHLVHHSSDYHSCARPLFSRLPSDGGLPCFRAT
jgi:hypothetical protein